MVPNPKSPGDGGQGTHIRQERPNTPGVLQLSRAGSSVLFHCHPLIPEEERQVQSDKLMIVISQKINIQMNTRICHRVQPCCRDSDVIKPWLTNRTYFPSRTIARVQKPKGGWQTKIPPKKKLVSVFATIILLLGLMRRHCRGLYATKPRVIIPSNYQRPMHVLSSLQRRIHQTPKIHRTAIQARGKGGVNTQEMALQGWGVQLHKQISRMESKDRDMSRCKKQGLLPFVPIGLGPRQPQFDTVSASRITTRLVNQELWIVPSELTSTAGLLQTKQMQIASSKLLAEVPHTA